MSYSRIPATILSKSIERVKPALAGLALLSMTFLHLPAVCAEGPQLQTAVPSFDSIEPAPSKPSVLKGGITHRHSAIKKQPVKKKVLSSSADRSDSGLAALRAQADAEKVLKQKAAIQENTQKFEFKLDRSIGIIGVKFYKYPGTPPVINRVFMGTPAWTSGLMVNDAIVAVDGVPTFNLSKDQCYDLIVGTPNTPVTISVKRRSGFEAKSMNRMDFNDIPDVRVREDYLRSL